MLQFKETIKQMEVQMPGEVVIPNGDNQAVAEAKAKAKAMGEHLVQVVEASNPANTAVTRTIYEEKMRARFTELNIGNDAPPLSSTNLK